MKTYSATFLANTRGGYKDAGFAVLLYYDDESAFLRFAMSDITYLTTNYVGAVQEVSFSESGFDPHDSSNINASCKVVLNDNVNAKSVHDVSSLLAGKAFINRKCVVYRYSDNTEPIANDPEFSGNISRLFYDVNSRQWVIECEHLHQHRTLPQTIITKSAYPKAPKQSIGSPLPILYGAFTMSGTSTRADAAHGLFHYVPTLCIDATKGIYVIAGHEIYSCVNTTVGAYIDGLQTYGSGFYTWDGSTEQYPTATLTGNANIQIYTPATNGVFRVKNTWVTPKNKGIYNQVSGDSDNAVDGDYNTSLSISASTRYAVKFPYGLLGEGGTFNATGTTSQLYTYAFFKSHSGSAVNGGLYNPVLNLAYSPSGHSGTGYQTYSISSPTTGYRSDADGNTYASALQWTWGEIALYEYYLSVPSATTLGISTLGILANDTVISGVVKETVEVSVTRTRGRGFGIISRPATRTHRRVTVDYLPDPYTQENGLSNIFVECSGRKFDTWIGSRNGLSSGQPIHKSCYIFESILRDELGVSGSDIDTDSIDDDYSSAYTMAFSLNKKESSQDIIEDLARQSACYMYRTSTGVWRIKRIPQTASTSDASLDWSDVRILNVDTTPQEWIENDVNVMYNYDYAVGQCTWNTNYVNSTSQGDTSLGTNSTAKIDVVADFIRKDSNSSSTNYAVNLRDYRIQMWKFPHSLVEFEVYNPEHLALEEGDIVDFVNVPTRIGGIGQGSIGNCWSSFTSPKLKYWMIYSRQPSLDKLTCKAIQLHNLATDTPS